MKKFLSINKLSEIDIRFLFLLGLLVFLPGFEVLKNLFAILFVLSWVVVAKKNNYWGGKWRIVDSIFLLWILADIAVSINAIITHQFSGSNFRDIIRFVLIAWVLSRTDFSKKMLIQSALFALVALIFTLGYGYYAGQGELKELYSVGHINHSGIFIVIAYAISLSLLLFNFKDLEKYKKIIITIITIILFLTSIDTGSRAVFGLLFIITLFNFFYLMIKVKKFSLMVAVLAITSCMGIFFAYDPPEALKEIQGQKSVLDDLHREQINNFSYYAFKSSPFLGVGFGNFSQITLDDIKPLVIADKGVFNSKLYSSASHAHNVFFTYLISGGLLIFSIFVWFWFYVGWIIIKLINRGENDWIVLSSIGVLMVNLGIGLVNTTLHHEHAIISMYVLGLLIAQYRKNQLFKDLLV
jgi:O-antigen ligase